MTIQQDIKLSEIFWFKIGGTAKYLLKAESKDDIFQALDFIEKNNIQKVFISGLGSNLVFTDENFDGAILQIAHNGNEQIELKNETLVEAFAGELLDHVITFAFDRNLTGLEFAGGLPGTVGAAIRGNVGAYGGEIKDHLLEAEVLIRKLSGGFEIKNIKNEDLNFSYRHSLIKENPGMMIVLSARFILKPGNNEEVRSARDTYELHINQRKERHPLEYPNCGSVFKNIREPEKIERVLTVYPDIKDRIDNQWYGKIASGYLIQRLGLQGHRVGDAQISMKHALFIINLGQAKASDVLTIIDTIQSKMFETFGFTLDPEVEIVQ